MLKFEGIHSKKHMLWYIIGLWISFLIRFSNSLNNEGQTSINDLPTVTVRGFLNFKTTVDGTVIVFTPISEPQPQIIAKTSTKSSSFEKHLQTLSTNNNDIFKNSISLESKDTIGSNNIQDFALTQPPLKPDPKEFIHFDRNNDELQHISENIVLPSTFQTENNLEVNLNKKSPSSINHYPTGLVTVLGGTGVENGKTTIYETKVLGTYIDGKYAQILQSTSKIITSSITSISSLTPDTSQIISVFDDSRISSSKDYLSVQSKILASSVTDRLILPSSDATVISEPPFKASSNEEASKSNIAALQSSFQVSEITSKSDLDIPTQTLESVKTNFFKYTSSVGRTFSTPLHSFNTEESINHSSKTQRLSSSRIRFKAPKRPSQTVRLNRFKVRLTLRQNSTDGFDLTTPQDDEEFEIEDHKKEEEDPTELSLEILDPASITYQETTITSEVTLHVGRRKSIRTLTITTSVPKRVLPTDGAMMTQHEYLDHDTQESAPTTQSVVVTKTYTTTERTYTTSIVPVIDGNTIGSHTVTESFFIMKIITAYRTLPPGHVTILTPSNVEELQTSTETPAITLDVAANDQSSLTQSLPEEQTTEISTAMDLITESTKPIPKTIPHNKQGVANPLLSFGQGFQNNPLAAVYLGLHQLNAQMTLYSTMTHTTTYVTTDTIYSTKTIRYYDGRSTRSRTTSEPISMSKRTVTTAVTSVQPYINTQAYQQQQQLQKLIAATQLPLQQAQQIFTTLTSVYTTSTTATSLSTRIYTLIYNGFSTKFRTVTSTKLYPTVLTVTNTKEVPISATQQPLLPFAYPYPAI